MASDQNNLSILRPGSGHATADRVQKSGSTTSTGPSAAGAAHLRSCVTCRRRKVKCDKKDPCGNCQKARIECVFPSPVRAPRKPRRPADNELLDRLRRLEGALQSLGAQVDEDANPSPPTATAAKEDDDRANFKLWRRVGTDKPESYASGCPLSMSPSTTSPNEENAPDLERRFGRLVVNEGKSRYINNSFWANLNAEVEDLKGILNDASDDEEDYPSPEGAEDTNAHQAFVFGFSSTAVNMRRLHPPPEQIPQLWSLFKLNVDPLVKVLHLPSLEPTILEARDRLDHLPRGLEALLFAIYYSTVTSLMPQECLAQFGDTQQNLLKKYRFALEQALARANFLEAEEMILLQAFVIFLIALRRNDDARIIWTLTGLVVRIAQTLGIHRDGSHFGLSPFEIEMRRRLWWQVCILDARASEDHGCDPTIVEAQFDTQMPLNVNDSDIYPEMTELPESRKGFTEMTFCLIRFEVANIFRRIFYVPPGPEPCTNLFARLTLEQKEKWISDCHQRLEETYLQNADLTVPLFWASATLSRLVLSKMWLVIYHPYQRLDGGKTLPQETKDKLFLTSLESVEYANLLDSDIRTQKWGWLFRTYVQWHSIAFMLSELCVRTSGPLVQRAWRAIEGTVRSRFGNTFTDSKRTILWRPLRKLMAKARMARQKQVASELQALGIPPLGTGDMLSETYPAIESLITRGSVPWDVHADNVAKAIGAGGNVFIDQQLANQPFQNQAYSSPSNADTPATSNNSDGTPSQTGPSPQVQQPSNNMGGQAMPPAGVNKAAQEFGALCDQGMEWLITDLVNGGDSTLPNTAGSDAVNPSQPLTNSPVNIAGNNGSPSGLTGDEMNWENWDDLVRQYAGGYPAVNSSTGLSPWY